MATAKTAAKPAAKAAPKAKTSTAVVVKKSTGAVSLADIKAKMAAEIAGLADRTAAPGGDKIQLKPGKFKLPDGTDATELQLVIVDFVATNSYYEGAYDKDNIVPPTCFAIGQAPTKLVPSDNSPAIQAESCAVCPMNQFGSSGAGKACKNGRRLAVLPPDADDDTPLWILEVSPTGLKGFDGYVRTVAAKFQLAPIGVITTVTLDPTVDFPKLVFGDPQPNENLGIHWDRKDEATKRLEQEPDVSSASVVAPPKSRKPAARATARR